VHAFKYIYVIKQQSLKAIVNLFRNRKLKEYQPITLTAAYEARYFFMMGKESIACKVFQLLYHPVLVVIIFPNKQEVSINHDEVYILKSTVINSSKLVNLQVKFYQKTSLNITNTHVFEVMHVDAGLGFLKNRYLKRIYNYSKAKDLNFIDDFTFEHYRKIVALFAQPKKVYLISMPDGGAHKKHFPIDLCAMNDNHFVIGIRNSNSVAAKLNVGDVFYISVAAAEAYHQIYRLGKFGGQKNELSIDDNIPNELLCDSTKVKLIQKIVLDHQTVFMATVMQTKTFLERPFALYHLHKLWFLFLENQTMIKRV
jgi:hypothetical protein